jgi:hypothetical protein
MFSVCSFAGFRACIQRAECHSERIIDPMRRVSVDGERCMENFYDRWCERKLSTEVTESHTTIRLDHVVRTIANDNEVDPCLLERSWADSI